MDEHRDYGTITSIWQINSTAGLEVQDLNGVWHGVPYAKNSVVVNIGDLLQRWSNDYFVSTNHRVTCSDIHNDKYSMPHFAHAAPGTIVSNLRKNEIAKYPPIESKEYLLKRLRRD
jgi:isopenicillin N synthase-like dioxygenase